MANTPRYAIYFSPASDSAVTRFGAAMLGYDAFSGEVMSFPVDVADAFADWAEVTSDPRKYGFHGTLKAPFSLADGQNEAELLAACGTFAATARPIPVIKPVIRAIGDFIAVVPDQRSATLDSLAQHCVVTFDRFRAPLSAADRARRNPAALTPRQVEHLDRWGYPYVAEEFRFHMTLTGRLAADRHPAIVAMLRERFDVLDVGSLPIDRLALFRQDDPASRFRIIAHHPLRSAD